MNEAPTSDLKYNKNKTIFNKNPVNWNHNNHVETMPQAKGGRSEATDYAHMRREPTRWA